YTVAAGCQVWLSGTGMDEPEREITEYYWDTNGDGVADRTSQSFWIHSDDLKPASGSNIATVGFWVRNELGAQSERQNLAIMINRVTPSMEAKPTSRTVDNEQGQVLVVRVDMSVVGRENVKRWQFSWGDESISTDIAVVASSMSCAHYFATPGGYDIALTITLTDGSTDTFSLLRFEFDVPTSGQRTSSGVADESPIIALEEPEVVLDPPQEQTAFDRALVEVADEWQPCTASENVLIDLATIEKMKKKRLYL
ncbi:MAG: hypothetical protein Q4G59_12290, partial [Planctomycetia bacterium]|nr:hypothetical protein [Planctomycetia bacterium]